LLDRRFNPVRANQRDQEQQDGYSRCGGDRHEPGVGPPSQDTIEQHRDP
jgi:hypothetical protein